MNLIPLGTNQTQVSFGSFKVFFSYRTPVAAFNNLTGEYYRTEKYWSKTTSRHINKWLEGIKAEERPQEFFDNLQQEVA